MKFKKWIIILMVALLAFPTFNKSVFASQSVEVKVEEFKLDGFSDFVGFFENPAILSLENGEIYLEFLHSGIEHLLSVDTINGNTVEVISESKEDDLRTYKVKLSVDDLIKPLKTSNTLSYSQEPYTGTMTLKEEQVQSFLETIQIDEGSGTDEESGEEVGHGPDEGDEPNQNGGSDEGQESDGDENPDQGEGSENGEENSNGNNEMPVTGEDTRIVAEIVSETEAKKIQAVTYQTNSNATASYVLNPAKLLELENGDKYVQFRVSDTGVDYFRSLKFNGEEVKWNSTSKGQSPYIIEYKLDNNKGLAEEIDVSMVIQAGPRIMPHEGIKISFDKDSLKEVIQIKENEKTPVEKNKHVDILNSKSFIVTPSDLPDNVEVAVKKVDVDSATDEENNDLSPAGDIYDFDFVGLDDYEGKFQLSLGYDSSKYSSREFNIFIYHLDEETGMWERVDSKVVGDTVTASVSEFSTYGVFATPKPTEEEPGEDPKEEPKEPQEEKYSIDYVVKHLTDDVESAANKFFKKPGVLVERDGKTYFQATVTGWNYFIEERIKHNGQAVKIVSVNEQDNSAVIEFEITGELSEEMILEMFLFYGNHDARLILDPDSMKPIEDEEEPGSGGSGGTTPIPGASGTDGTDNKGNTNDTSNQQPSDKITPDQAFEFKYTILKEDKDEVSAANNFFTGVGHLLKKNGKQYIQLEIDGWQFVDWIKVMKTGKLVDLIKVENDKALVQFEYNGSLTDVIWLEMSITVPGVYNGEVYKTRLVVDQDSIKEVNPEDHTIFIAKPDLTGDKGDKSDKKNATNNPKTGDTSQVMFYTMLLIASLFVLGYQIRKQRAISA